MGSSSKNGKVNVRERDGRNDRNLSSRVHTHFEGLTSCIK